MGTVQQQYPPHRCDGFLDYDGRGRGMVVAGVFALLKGGGKNTNDVGDDDYADADGNKNGNAVGDGPAQDGSGAGQRTGASPTSSAATKKKKKLSAKEIKELKWRRKEAAAAADAEDRETMSEVQQVLTNRKNARTKAAKRVQDKKRLEKAARKLAKEDKHKTAGDGIVRVESSYSRTKAD